LRLLFFWRQGLPVNLSLLPPIFFFLDALRATILGGQFFGMALPLLFFAMGDHFHQQLFAEK